MAEMKRVRSNGVGPRSVKTPTGPVPSTLTKELSRKTISKVAQSQKRSK